MAFTLFNIYTNDQFISTDNNVKHCIYVDDSEIAVQKDSFKSVETKFSKTLDCMWNCYKANYLKPNPSKTIVYDFHLRNKHANRKLVMKWKDVELTHCSTPTYLDVTLDRALRYKTHCEKTITKINTRNGLIRKLTESVQGAQPHYESQQWHYASRVVCMPGLGSSIHKMKVDIVLNTTCRQITGCFRNTKK